MDTVIDKGIRVNLRMRFTCTVYRAIAPEDNVKGKGVKAVKSVGGDILMGEVGKAGWEALEGGLMSAGAQQAAFAAAGGPAAIGSGPTGEKTKKEKEVMCFTTRPMETFEVLNDLVVDRGPSPYVSLLELFGDEHHMTTVQADGLTVSTPTGSTAYSVSRALAIS
jgi:NAD+ kinase